MLYLKRDGIKHTNLAYDLNATCTVTTAVAITYFSEAHSQDLATFNFSDLR